MCYDISYMTKRAERYAEHYRIDKAEATRTMANHPPVYHVQAFAHPDIPVITNEAPNRIQFFQWGLIPFWVKDVSSATKISNRTLNARGEEMFEKPSFRQSARKKRCLVVVDGFFEHHWYHDNSYPYFIANRKDKPISLGGLWETWRLDKEGIERHTVSIVTTAANKMISYIHNHPKASNLPRMPLVIPEGLESDWLTASDDPVGIKMIKELVKPYSDNELIAYPVSRLRGKAYAGNTPQIQQPIQYDVDLKTFD